MIKTKIVEGIPKPANILAMVIDKDVNLILLGSCSVDLAEFKPVNRNLTSKNNKTINLKYGKLD